MNWILSSYFDTYRIHTLGKLWPKELPIIFHPSLWMAKLIIPNLECITSLKKYLIRNMLYGDGCMHNTTKMSLILLLICHIQCCPFMFSYENTFGYLYNLVRYELSWDIIKYPQLLTQYLRKNDSGKIGQTIIASHQRCPKYSLFLS